MRQPLILLLILLAAALSLHAQTKTEDSLAKQKDLRDIADKIFNRQAAQTPTVEGKFHNSPFPAAGYTLVTGIAAVFSDRMDFGAGDTTSKITDILSSVTY